MNIPSVFSAVRAIGASDMLFSLRNSRHQRGLPFLELTLLCVVFVALTPLFFPDAGTNGLALGVLTTFLVFWGSVILSFLVLVLFGLDTPTGVVEKATFVALATFTIAILLFDFNLLVGLETIEYVGDDWEPRWLVPLAYSLPYPIFCLALGEFTLRGRLARRVGKATPAQRQRLTRIKSTLTAKAVVSAAAIICFSAMMMYAGVISEERAGFQKAVVEVTKALTFRPPA